MVRFIFCAIYIFAIFSSASAQDFIVDFEHKIDSMVQNAIDSMAFPGAQLLIIHQGQVLIDKNYGYHSYDNEQPVKSNDLYDLASVTKVMGGGLALMKMQEKGLFSPDEKLGETHPYFNGSDKENILWREILAHQARMKPYIVFWQTARRKNKKWKWRTFSPKNNSHYSIHIDQHLNLHRRYPRKMQKYIKNSDLLPENKYLYSGLSFLLIPDLVYRRTGQCFDEFLQSQIFDSLDNQRITFNPIHRFPLNEIVPTENDTFFRKALVHGYVHDENASMLNGVSANAGLFANARTLGEICEHLLSPENELIRQSIVNQYTKVQFPDNDNRRGLTFDKPLLEYDDAASYVAKSASPESFGHSGFTGTFIWIDPTHQLTFIFLSNRVHPFRSQRKLYSMNFRPKIHQAAYDYILTKSE